MRKEPRTPPRRASEIYDKDHFVRQGAGQPIPAMIEVIHLIL